MKTFKNMVVLFLAAAGISLIVIWCFPEGSIFYKQGYDAGYKIGQIDAINGNIQVKKAKRDTSIIDYDQWIIIDDK